MAQCGFAARTTSIKEHVSLVTPLFRADLGTNLIKRGGGGGGGGVMSKVSQIAQFNCLMVSKRLRVRAPVRPRFFSSSVTDTNASH